MASRMRLLYDTIVLFKVKMCTSNNNDSNGGSGVILRKIDFVFVGVKVIIMI